MVNHFLMKKRSDFWGFFKACRAMVSEKVYVMDLKMNTGKILAVCALSMGIMGLLDAGGNHGCEGNCREEAVHRSQNYSDFLSAAAKCKGPSNSASFNTHDQSSPFSDYGNTSAFSGR